MESSPSKRRKISPQTSVSVDATESPSRIPVRKDATKPMPHRPSFASPTKASIARHNPQLLHRLSSPGSSRAGRGGRNLDDVFVKALSRALPSTEQQDARSGEEGDKSLGSTTVENDTPEEDTTTLATGQSNTRRFLSVGLSAKPRRMSRSPKKQTPSALSSVRENTPTEQDFEGAINPLQRAGLRRSPIRSQEMQEQGADFNPFERRGLRRSPPASSVLPRTSEAEIRELEQRPVPITSNLPINNRNVIPSNLVLQSKTEHMPEQTQHSGGQLIASADNSPHVSSPVARSRMRLDQDEELELPPILNAAGVPDPISTTPQTGIHDILSSKARRSKDLAKKLPSSPSKGNLQSDPRLTKASKLDLRAESEPEPAHPEKPSRRKSARFSIPEDPYAPRKKLRDDLLKELEQLQADVALAHQENERLQRHYKLKRSPPTEPPNPEELLSLLVRSAAPGRPKVDAARSSPFISIGSFLPFSSRRKRMSRASAPLDKPAPSHLPIDVENPLPYLQAFSPLTYTSKITLLPQEPQASKPSSQETQSISQLHLITASHLSGLFTARMSMIVDTFLLSISSIHMDRLPPCAENELGNFLRDELSQDGTLTKDIGLICWAMGRWVEVSVLRARFWCTVENEFGTPEARAISLQKKKKRKRRHVVTEDNNEEPLDTYDEKEFKKQKWTRRQLLPHMGRTAIELATDKMELRIEWRLKFDWTGEVDSSITASVRLPQSCQSSIPSFYSTRKVCADINHRARIR